jgi:hypothetical protein
MGECPLQLHSRVEIHNCCSRVSPDQKTGKYTFQNICSPMSAKGQKPTQPQQ